MDIPTTIATRDQLTRLRAVVALILPGDANAPAATALPDLDTNLARALAAVGHEGETVLQATADLPEPLDWDALREWAGRDPQQFDTMSSVIAGAYFMSDDALDAIGYPHGPRRRAPHDQAVDELSSGVLDRMLAQESMLREVPA